MLSRTADNLYWLARYVERAEYLARILEVTQRLTTLPLAYVGSSNEWESAVATAGCAHAFAAAYPEANEEAVTDFLCFSSANPSSIRNCFEIARTNTSAVFDFACKLVTSKSASEVIAFSTAHARQQFDTVSAQSKELLALAQKVAIETAEPIKQSVTKAFNKVV